MRTQEVSASVFIFSMVVLLVLGVAPFFLAADGLFRSIGFSWGLVLWSVAFWFLVNYAFWPKLSDNTPTPRWIQFRHGFLVGTGATCSLVAGAGVSAYALPLWLCLTLEIGALLVIGWGLYVGSGHGWQETPS